MQAETTDEDEDPKNATLSKQHAKMMSKMARIKIDSYRLVGEDKGRRESSSISHRGTDFHDPNSVEFISR